MSEEMLSNEERNAILNRALNLTPKKDVNTPKRSSELSEGTSDLSQASFGELLERSLEIRENLDKEDAEKAKEIDESRQKAIAMSRMDILEGWNL